MEKRTEHWTVEQLRGYFLDINFPEYQREPTVWTRGAKQRLIDSMLRQFDIASLYFYQNPDKSLDCIDGRQRINAIMSFLGENTTDQDDGFPLRILNEIYEEDGEPFGSLSGMSFKEIEQAAANRGGRVAKTAQQMLLGYEVTCVLLSQVARPEEFNLQFTRLNLGAIINAGEKMHAMVGAMRNLCFDDERIGKHPFLNIVRIPIRRYAKEQVAAQVVAQVFSKKKSGKFTRSRHFDLQRFLKKHAVLTQIEQEWIRAIASTFDVLVRGLAGSEVFLRNRAVTVSTVLLAWEREMYNKPTELDSYARFLEAFLSRLRWQVGKELDVDPEYRYLIDFQRHVTQASVEKPAVEARSRTMTEQFERWLKEKKLRGDDEFGERTGMEPDQACRQGK